MEQSSTRQGIPVPRGTYGACGASAVLDERRQRWAMLVLRVEALANATGLPSQRKYDLKTVDARFA
jgi:hypothetical protein